MLRAQGGAGSPVFLISPDGGGPELPGYEIGQELGRGGMGVVYKARQIGLNRVVALKMMLGGILADPRARARFRKEARAVARLQHPNIVQIFDVGEYGGNDFFSLEYVEGGSLADRLRHRPLGAGEAARLIGVLARAVHFAHEHGVVHRDLKPANILLSENKGESDSWADGSVCELPAETGQIVRVVPKIADFGLAKTQEEDMAQTGSGMAVGTPAYMAPEQAAARAAGPAADIWALGVLLYQATTGHMPFAGNSPMEVMAQVAHTEPVAPRQLSPRLPGDLETIILKCLEKEPARRYGTARELADDLGRFLAHEPILACPISGLQRAARWARKRPITTAVLVAGAMAALGLLVALGLHTRNERKRVAHVTRKIEVALGRARDAARRGVWEDVHALLDEPRHQFKDTLFAVALRDEVRELAEGADARLKLRALMRAFRQKRDEALFHAARSLDVPSRRRRTHALILATLKLVGATASRPPALEGKATEAEKEEVHKSSHELLLLLAEINARDGAGDGVLNARAAARSALAILETAAKCGPIGHAVHLARARYLRQAGSKAEADREQARAAKTLPKSVTSHYLTGIEHLRLGNLYLAEKELAGALSLEAGHFWARYFLALCQIRRHSVSLANANLSACLAQKPGWPWIHLMRGQVLQLRGMADEACEDFHAAEQLLAWKPDPEASYFLLINRSSSYLQQNMPAKTEADLKKAIALREKAHEAHLLLGQLHLKQEETGRALRCLADAVKHARTQLAAREVDAMAVLSVIRLRSGLLDREGRGKEAVALLDQALKLEGLPALERAFLYRDKGAAMLRAGQLLEAKGCYERALALKPRWADFWRWHGETLLKLRDPKAEKSFEAALNYSAQPELSLYHGRGLARLLSGNRPGAILDLSVALALAPKDAGLMRQRGDAYLAAGDWIRAEQDFSDSLELAAAHPDALRGRSLARLEQGRLPAAQADAAAARTAFDATVRQLTQVATLYLRIADEMAKGNPERTRCLDLAMDALERALERTPKLHRRAFWRNVISKDTSLRRLTGHRVWKALVLAYGS